MRPDRIMDLAAGILLFIVWLVIVWLIWIKKAKGVTYIGLFTIFYIYVASVLYYTVFQFQSLLVLRYFAPGLRLKGSPVEESVNPVPLVTLTAGDMTTSLLNVLLFVPFGFGLPFVSKLRFRGTIVAGAAFSVAIEAVQFATGHLAGFTFRVADVNDVIFNTTGAMIGYGLFTGFVRAYLRVFPARTER